MTDSGETDDVARRRLGERLRDARKYLGLKQEEVAAYLKAGKRTVYRLAQKGEIPAFKLGGTWRFRRSELDRWIAESINKKKPEAE